jgi:hypothetical protein
MGAEETSRGAGNWAGVKRRRTGGRGHEGGAAPLPLAAFAAACHAAATSRETLTRAGNRAGVRRRGAGGRRGPEGGAVPPPLARETLMRVEQAAASRDFPRGRVRATERQRRKEVRDTMVILCRCLFFFIFLPFNPTIVDGIRKQW